MADDAIFEVRAPCPKARGGGRVLGTIACFLLLECRLSWDGEVASKGRVYNSWSWSLAVVDRDGVEGIISRAAR